MVDICKGCGLPKNLCVCLDIRVEAQTTAGNVVGPTAYSSIMCKKCNVPMEKIKEHYDPNFGNVARYRCPECKKERIVY